jgi:uncharacterized protein YbjT (DUF2867 family)
VLPRRVLVTGATGYVGGRLVPELLRAGFEVRCLARRPAKLRDQPWIADVEVAEGDVGDPTAVRRASEGVDVAYYLVHSLGTGHRFARRDLDMARGFVHGLADSPVQRLVYLGGLAPDTEELSAHLASRREVGEVLLASGIPTVVLRAAIILGSGSASFEMMRYLSERLPVMVAPRWVDTRIQPIAVRDVLRYLVAAATIPRSTSRGFDIGGPEILTYRQMMQRYAAIAGLSRRRIVGVPLLTPRLSSLWVGLVTPVPSSLARPLVESLRNEVVCKERDIAAYVPDPPEGLLTFERAVRLALQKIREYDVATAWHSADLPGTPSDPLPTDPDWAGGTLYVDDRSTVVDAPVETVWRVVEGIGGDQGWYSWPLAWATRGVIDRVSGGPGLRRGRRHPYALAVGDALDWWRVEEVTGPHLLRLRAEMRLPGLAWLELMVRAQDDGRTVLRQRAVFHPHGLPGHLYWKAISPFHGIVFGGMQRNIARAAEAA